MRRKLFSFILALVASAGIVNAKSDKITFGEESIAKGEWSNGKVFTGEDNLISVKLVDPDAKMEIDLNPANFGTIEQYEAFGSRLKSGGKSSSTKNYMEVTVKEDGIFYIYARAGSSSDVTRNVVIANGMDTVFNQIFKDADAVEHKVNTTTIKIYPVYSAELSKGVTYRLSYPVGSINFYSLDFQSDDTDNPSGTCGDNLTWLLNTEDSTLTITGSGAMTSHPWAEYKSYIKYVSLPDGLTTIGFDAFENCSNLTSVTIGNSVTSIGYSAFSGCTGLTSVTIGNSVTSIGGMAFYECSALTALTIPNSVTSIGDNAFEYCSGLTSIEIPNSVTSIGNSAFWKCTGLKSVTISNSLNRIEYAVFALCSGLTSVTIPNSVTSIGINAFSGCGSLTSVTIPDGVTSIESNAFSGCNSLTSVTIPNSVTSIGERAFSGCSGLTSMTIPSNVTSIGSDAFLDCSNIKSVIWNAKNCTSSWFGSQVESFTFGSEVEVIPDNICENMHLLTSISIPNSVTIIGEGAFKHCTSLTGEIVIPGNVTKIGNESFCATALNGHLVLPNALETIGDNAFEGCEFTSVTFGTGLTYIGDRAFYGNRMKEITIPKGVLNIGKEAFGYCLSLTSIVVDSQNTVYDSRENCNAIIETSTNTLIAGCKGSSIPQGITTIGDDAFYYCEFSYIEIPNSVTRIGKEAFMECYALTDLLCEAVIPPTCGENAFKNVPKSIPVYVPAESVEAYQTAEQWSEFENILSLADSQEIVNPVHIGDLYYNLDYEHKTATVTYLEKESDYKYYGLTSVSIPSSVRYNTINYIVNAIGEYAFYKCSGLTNVTIPNSIDSIGDHAFASCSGLVGELVIPNSVTNIGNRAFQNCTGLTSVTIGNSVTSIGDFAFNGCSGLASVTIPNSVTSMGMSVFSQCAGLKSVTLGNGIVQIADGTFSECTGLTSIEIPNSVTSIGEYAFAYCSSLSGKLVIPDSVTVIKDAAFVSCTNLTELTIGSRVTNVGTSALSECTGLTSITCKATTPPYCNWSFGGIIPSVPLYVPSLSVEDYQQANEWKDFSPIIGIDDSRLQVTFQDWDGTILFIDLVEEGAAATAPANPTREGYTFTGWDKEFSNVIENMVVTALYEKNNEPVSAIPTPQDLAAYFDLVNNVVYCIQFIDNAEVCNPVRFVGTYNNWGKGETSTEAWSNCEKFTPVLGFEGWYAVEIPYINNFGGKPIQETLDGSWSWDYQCGDADAWVYVGGRELTIYSGYVGECDVEATAPGAYIYQLKYWKNHKTPCVPPTKHLYTITLYAPDACSEMKPAIIGDFNGWAEGIPMTEGVDGDSKTVYTYSFTDEEEHGFKIKEVADSDWTNELQYYNTLSDNWYVFSNYILGNDTNIVLDYSDNSSYRFAKCDGSKNVIINGINYYLDRETFLATVIRNEDNGYTGNIIIPDSVTYQDIHYNVTSIGEIAFSGSTGLTSIEIPNSVTSIGMYAFNNCSGLTSITNYATTPQGINSDVFDNVDKSTCVLNVPKESVSLYQAAEGWKEFTNIVGVDVPGEDPEEPIETIEGDYTVYYVNKDNQDLSDEVVTLHVPVAPVIEGFTFIGWQTVSSMLSEGITLQAVYQADVPSSAPAVYTNPSNSAQKLIRNGNVYILTDDKTYTITGQQVK